MTWLVKLAQTPQPRLRGFFVRHARKSGMGQSAIFPMNRTNLVRSVGCLIKATLCELLW